MQEPPSQDFCTSNKESSHNDDDSLTSNVGTALYVSPEVITSKQPYNQKVDLYSLGIIFFEMSYKPLNTGMERCKVLGLVRQSNIQFPDDFDSIVQPTQVINLFYYAQFAYLIFIMFHLFLFCRKKFCYGS